MQHDKHTYYFEKYLRNEMTRNEKSAFEKKLSIDAEFKAHFDAYAANHEAIIREELAEYYEEDIIPDKPKSYSWFLVLLSVLGLALIIDYYANQKYFEEQKANQTYKEEIVDRLKNAFVEPFKKMSFNKNNKQDSINKVVTISADNSYYADYQIDTLDAQGEDSVLIEEKIIDQFEQLMRDKNLESNLKDIFIEDSLMLVVDLEKFKEKFTYITHATDTLLTDSAITRLAVASLFKMPNANKPLFVEFWQSLVGFNGYQFNGKKLVVYGLKKPFNVFILKHNNQYILHSNWGETALQGDNLLHKFED